MPIQLNEMAQIQSNEKLRKKCQYTIHVFLLKITIPKRVSKPIPER